MGKGITTHRINGDELLRNFWQTLQTRAIKTTEPRAFSLYGASSIFPYPNRDGDVEKFFHPYSILYLADIETQLHNHLVYARALTPLADIPDFVFARIIGQWDFVMFQGVDDEIKVIANGKDLPDFTLEMADFNLEIFLNWFDVMDKKLDRYYDVD